LDGVDVIASFERRVSLTDAAAPALAIDPITGLSRRARF
jgi:hypothetical protein